MSKTIIAFSFMLASLGASAAINKAIRVTSQVENNISITKVFNGSLFTSVCRGQIRALTANDEVIVKEIKKLIVRGEEVQVLNVDFEEEIVASEADLICQF